MDRRTSKVGVFLDTGVKKLNSNNPSGAKVAFLKALKKDPNNADAHHLLGLAYNALGQTDKGIKRIEKAVAINGENQQFLNNLGQILRSDGQIDDACRVYQRALKLAPRDPDILNNLGNAYSDVDDHAKAIECFSQVIAVSPTHIMALYNLGSVYCETAEFTLAMECLEKVISIAPNHFEAINNLGLCYLDMEDLDKAEKEFNKAIAIAPDYAEAHYNLGNLYRLTQRMELAVDCFTRTLTIIPDHISAVHNLGITFKNLGQFTEAEAQFRQAILLDPNFSDAYRHLTMVKKFSDTDDDIQSLIAAYANPDLNEEQKMQLSFGLGKAFEDMQHYEKAFEYYTTANTLKSKRGSFSIQHARTQFKNIKDLFTRDLIKQFIDCGNPDKTPIFILGMPRSGTTLVEQILASHPNVYGAGELDYLRQSVRSHFGKVEDITSPTNFPSVLTGKLGNAAEDYIGKIREMNDTAEFITDKMPDNFRFIGLLKLMLPHSKIIHCVRDPRDTCLSNFKCNFINSAIGFSDDLRDLGQYYNLYTDLMAHWHSVMPGAIYDIQYEAVVADLENQSRALLDHCGLGWNNACLEFYKTKRPVQTASDFQVRTPIYSGSVGSWKNYEIQLGPLLDEIS